MPQTFAQIATTTLSSATTTINFSSIPQTYTDLKIIGNWFSTGGALQWRYNGTTTALYTQQTATSSGTTTTSAVVTTAANYITLNGTNSSNWYSINMDLLGYRDNNYRKYALYHWNGENTGSAGRNQRGAGVIANATAISSIEFTLSTGGNFDIGTTFSIFGILAA